MLALIAGKFEIFLTVDQNIRFQQNLENLPFAVLFVSVRSNMIDAYRPLFSLMKDTAEKLLPGQIAIIP